MAVAYLCLEVLRDWNNLEFIANINFQIISLLLGEMPISWYVKASLMLFMCMYSSHGSDCGYQQQGCNSTQAEGSPCFGCVKVWAYRAATACFPWDPVPLPALHSFSVEQWDPQGVVVISHLATALRAPRSVMCLLAPDQDLNKRVLPIYSLSTSLWSSRCPLLTWQCCTFWVYIEDAGQESLTSK